MSIDGVLVQIVYAIVLRSVMSQNEGSRSHCTSHFINQCN
jgi:hypothetical protein